MAKQKKLFPEPATTIKVAATCSEPMLWVRRLVVWETPDKILRQVHLRRGLNIVWSPGISLFPHDHRTWAVIGIYGRARGQHVLSPK